MRRALLALLALAFAVPADAALRRKQFSSNPSTTAYVEYDDDGGDPRGTFPITRIVYRTRSEGTRVLEVRRKVSETRRDVVANVRPTVDENDDHEASTPADWEMRCDPEEVCDPTNPDSLLLPEDWSSRMQWRPPALRRRR